MRQETHQVNIIEESRMTPATDAVIRELLCICFPLDINVFSQTRYWHGSVPTYSLIQEENGRILGHVGVVVRLVRCGNSPSLVAGIQNLAVRPELRGSGVGCQLVVESMKEARRRNIVWGLLFCVPELETFYGNLGWHVVHDTVKAKDEPGRDSPILGRNICMSKCVGSSPFPRGEIHLEGADW
jgi:N-acetylglutamate synthase-like GNAT family acetyltransferase